MDISSEGHIVLHILGILGFIISIYVLCRQNKSTFADMDKNMREMGLGDLRVSKKIKELATAFYGRIKAYDEGIAGLDGATLNDALKRNLFLDTEPSEAHVRSITNYLTQEIAASSSWSFANIQTSNISFGTIPE